MPAEFQIQHEDIANPPTLILAIEKLLNMHISETESIETIKGDVAFEVEPQGNSKLIVDGSMSTETELSFFTEVRFFCQLNFFSPSDPLSFVL